MMKMMMKILSQVRLKVLNSHLQILHIPKINDPVKMYLKEIGRVELLDPKEEPEIARRIQAGDEEAKKKLISANLRLVVSNCKKICRTWNVNFWI